MVKLTPKMRLFADGLIAGKTGLQAAVDAGYSEKSAGNTATKLRKHPAVQEYLEITALSEDPDLDVSKEWQLKTLREIVDRGLQVKPAYSSSGKQIKKDGSNVWTFQGQLALKALDQIGKITGTYAPEKVEVNQRVIEAIEIINEGMSDGSVYDFDPRERNKKTEGTVH